MKGICFIWFRGRHFSPSMPAWSSRADRYLKLLNSRYKRSGGRNLGDIRDGTPLSRHVKRYCLLVPFFFFCPVRRIPLCACVAFPFLLWRTIGKGSGGSNKKHPRVYSTFTLRGENHSQGAVTESAWVAATSNEPQTKINLNSIKTSCGVLVSNFNVGVQKGRRDFNASHPIEIKEYLLLAPSLSHVKTATFKLRILISFCSDFSYKLYFDFERHFYVE